MRITTRKRELVLVALLLALGSLSAALWTSLGVKATPVSRSRNGGSATLRG